MIRDSNGEWVAGFVGKLWWMGGWFKKIVGKCVLFHTSLSKKEEMNFKLFYFIQWLGAFETWQKVNAKIITNFIIKYLQANVIVGM